MSLAVPSLDHMFWSDALDQGWGATVADQFASGLWLEGEELFFHQPQGAVGDGEWSLPAPGVSERTCGSGVFRQHHSGGLSSSSGGNALSHSQLSGSADPSLGGERGDLHLSTVCSSEEQCSSRCSISSQPGGGDRVDSSPGGLRLRKRWPVVIDLFASSLNHRCGVYFAPVSDPMAVGTDAMLQSWDHLLGYAFPPFAMIPQVLRKLRESSGAVATLVALFWPQKEWFPDLLELLLELLLLLPERWDLLRQPHVRRYHQHLSVLRLHAWRLSRDLREPPDCLLEWLDDLALSCRASSIANYQCKW